ncbi:MAG: tryptophan synthase subunit alpha [Anaerolineaceae bacterium]|nr:tryptophan synthase subunit alpha [Anaerolineaceae bacterium]
MTITGTDRITAAFQQAQSKQTAALMPYFTLGYPDATTSLDIVEAIASYSDLLELGVPFSDPLADGPTVQHSTQVSLENGTTTAKCLEMVRQLRQRGVQTPIMLMGYVNPILAYGEANYARDAADAGADGFIVPDLPPEEAEDFDALSAEAGLSLIHLLAPTSNQSRIDRVAARARGFIYLVSVTGVTGARSQVRTDLAGFVNRVRAETAVPLAVGFGISTPAQAAEVGQVADGVIVGSAFINAVNAGEDKVEAAVQFVKSLQEALLK